MQQGKLISFTPLMTNGVHETYSGKNGLLYKFNMVIEGTPANVMGVVNSTRQQPSWKIGEEYTYEVVVNGNFTNIRSLKLLDAPTGYSGGGGGFQKRDTTFVVQKCFEASVECAIAFFELNQDYYTSQEIEDKLISRIFNHLIEGEEQRRWINISAMRLSISKMRANGMFDKEHYKTLSEWLFAQATAIANTMEATVKQIVEQDKLKENK